MTRIAARLESLGWTLRSGGAGGADASFEAGCSEPALKEIYLPWKGFNGLEGPVVDDDAALREVSMKFHPAWERLTRGGRALMTRNVAQILGPKLDSPVEMVICWTPDGQGGGGTGQAIRIARSRNIPVFDLFFGLDALGEFMRARK